MTARTSSLVVCSPLRLEATRCGAACAARGEVRRTGYGAARRGGAGAAGSASARRSACWPWAASAAALTADLQAR